MSYAEIRRERERQDEQWGQQNHHPVYWVSILTEELGEVAKEAIELDNYDGPARRAAARRLRAELVQLAAVAVATIDYLDREEGTL